MRTRILIYMLLGSIGLGTACSNYQHSTAFKMTETAPVAQRKEHPTTIHGETREDDYFWLREKTNPEVIDYLNAENAWADRFLDQTKPLAERIYAEIKARIQESDNSVPYRLRDWLYFSRTEEGKQYTTYYRRPAAAPEDESKDEVLLDVNQLADGQSFMAVGDMSVSPNGKLLAYTTDNTGYREYTLRFLDLTTRKHYEESIPNVASIAWCDDNRTVFYTTEDKAKRPYRLHRHELGSATASDPQIYEEPDERFRVSVWRSLSDGYIFFQAGSHTTSDVRFVASDRPTDPFLAIAPRKQDHEYSVSHRGDSFFIRTNDRGRNFRLVRTPVAKPQPENWEELIPHREDVMLASARAFANFTAITERAGGLVRLRFLDAQANVGNPADHYLEFPESVYDARAGANHSFDLTEYRYNYQSMVTAPSVLDYDPTKRKSTLRKATPVLGGYDKSEFRTLRVHAKAPDGTAIPISIVHHRDTAIDGTAPLFLTGYGAYGYPYPAHFTHARLSLLTRGMVYAIAHIRGGGEMGKPWHDGGRMANKANTFTDFIACTEHLIREGYADPSKVVVKGGSAGGLLMGAISNMRPDLFSLVILDVPFVDVINTMLDKSLPLTVIEYEEWGNPNIAAEYAQIRKYCPYSNLDAHAYPAMFVKTSLNDSQVGYWEPAKYVAKLRTLKTNETPLLFKTNMAGGHGGSSGRYDSWRETAEEYALALWLTGIRE